MPELPSQHFHGFAHECGEIGRLPGRDQIAVNHHLPVFIKCPGLFKFIRHRQRASGTAFLQQFGIDQVLRSVAGDGHRFILGASAQEIEQQ